MNTSVPCKDCPDRVLYCHTTCPKYKEFAEQCAARRKATFDDKAVEAVRRDSLVHYRTREQKMGKIRYLRNIGK